MLLNSVSSTIINVHEGVASSLTKSILRKSHAVADCLGCAKSNPQVGKRPGLAIYFIATSIVGKRPRRRLIKPWLERYGGRAR